MFAFDKYLVVKMSSFDPTKYYETLSVSFGAYHQNPTNVLFHLITTPVGLVGAVGLLHKATNSSSAAMFLVSIYLLSLLPVVPNGVFLGTALMCGLIVYLARQLKFGIMGSLGLIAIGYLIQDLSHLGTGEETFQSTYSAGGQVILFCSL